MPIQIKRILSVPFMENAYVIWDDKNEKKECVVIDPGLEPQKIADFLAENSLIPTAILCTHGHADHMAGVTLLKEHYPDAKTVIGAKDAKKLVDAYENLSAHFGLPVTVPPADVILFTDDNSTAETLHFAGLEIEARHTPGHSSGHAVFWVKGCTPEIIFVGDLIFERGVGRTDFPDGDENHLAASIRQQIYTFPDGTILYPGHGDQTTVGAEKKLNPFVREH